MRAIGNLLIVGTAAIVGCFVLDHEGAVALLPELTRLALSLALVAFAMFGAAAGVAFGRATAPECTSCPVCRAAAGEDHRGRE